MRVLKQGTRNIAVDLNLRVIHYGNFWRRYNVAEMIPFDETGVDTECLTIKYIDRTYVALRQANKGKLFVDLYRAHERV